MENTRLSVFEKSDLEKFKNGGYIFDMDSETLIADEDFLPELDRLVEAFAKNKKFIMSIEDAKKLAREIFLGRRELYIYGNIFQTEDDLKYSVGHIIDSGITDYALSWEELVDEFDYEEDAHVIKGVALGSYADVMRFLDGKPLQSRTFLDFLLYYR